MQFTICDSKYRPSAKYTIKDLVSSTTCSSREKHRFDIYSSISLQISAKQQKADILEALTDDFFRLVIVMF